MYEQILQYVPVICMLLACLIAVVAIVCSMLILEKTLK